MTEHSVTMRQRTGASSRADNELYQEQSDVRSTQLRLHDYQGNLHGRHGGGDLVMECRHLITGARSQNVLPSLITPAMTNR